MLCRLAEGCGLDSTGSGQGPAVSCCKCGDEPSGSCATELVKVRGKKKTAKNLQYGCLVPLPHF
jgi:hypothetical protein